MDAEATIVGRGMIARAFEPLVPRLGRTLIFASGVSDSSCSRPEEYGKERRLLETTIDGCLADGRRLVYFSSAGAVYGDWQDQRDETTPLSPNTMYGENKVVFEEVIRDSGVDYLIARLPNVVGPVQNPNNLVPTLVRQAVEGRARILTHACRDIMDVVDVADLIARLVTRGVSSQVVLVASGICRSAADLFDLIQEQLGTSATVQLVDGGIPHRYRIDNLRRLLGMDDVFPPDYPSLVISKYAARIAREIQDP